MNKQLLSFASLVALAVAHPSLRAVAAPSDSPASAAESDRQFLNNLENKDAAKPAPAPSVPAPVASASPQPQVMPTPVQPAAPASAAAPAAPAPQRRVQSADSQTVINGRWSASDTSDAPNPRPARSVPRVTSIAPRKEVQTRPANTVPARREVTAVQSETGDVRINDGPGASARISKSRTVDGSVPVASKVTVRKSREAAQDEEGTHIIQPAEVVQYGVAPTVPTKTTRVTTTTYVQQPTTAPQQADGNEARDEDRNQEKRFFHRLFNGGLFKKHVDDHD